MRREAWVLNDEDRGCLVDGGGGGSRHGGVWVATAVMSVAVSGAVPETDGTPWWHINGGLRVLEANRRGGLLFFKNAGRREVVEHGVTRCMAGQYGSRLAA